MNIIKWIFAVLITFGIVVSVAGLILFKIIAETSAPNEYTENVSDVMRRSLDTPFLFVLDLKYFSATYLVKDSDLFSTWGYVLLLRDRPETKSNKNLSHDITKLVLHYHWQRDNSAPTDTSLHELLSTTINFDTFGMSQTRPDLLFTQNLKSNSDQNTTTRYLSRLWISNDKNKVIMFFRVDSE